MMQVSEVKTVDDLKKFFKIDYVSVSWGQTRTIKNAGNREIKAHAIAPYGAIIVFPKRGGYLAYKCVKDHQYCKQLRCSNIKLLSAVKEMHDIKDMNVGTVKLDKDFEVKLIKMEVIDKL